MEKHEELFVAIRKIIRIIDIRSKKLSKEAGITGPQLLVLQELARLKGVTAKEVSTAINLSQATVTNIIDRLEDKGFILRSRSTVDRRRVSLFLTETGKEALIKAPQPTEDKFIGNFSALEMWEQSLLVSSLQRVASLMEADHIDAAPVLNLGSIQPSAESKTEI